MRYQNKSLYAMVCTTTLNSFSLKQFRFIASYGEEKDGVRERN
jgi:hypothetical protein